MLRTRGSPQQGMGRRAQADPAHPVTQRAANPGTSGNRPTRNQRNRPTRNQRNRPTRNQRNRPTRNQRNRPTRNQRAAVPGTSGNRPTRNQPNRPSKDRSIGHCSDISDVVLTGLQGKEVSLSWSIFSKDASTRLQGNWLNDMTAYELEATTAHDTGSVELWAPLPKARGKYFIRTTLRVKGFAIASSDSEEFE